MSGITKVVLMVFFLMVAVAGLACVPLSYHVIPTSVDKNAVAWVVKAGICDANEFEGYQNLAKAEKLNKALDAANDLIQFRIKQQSEKESKNYQIHKAIAVHNYKMGMAREKAWLSPTGILPLAMGLTGFGGFTGLIGLFRRKPGDIPKSKMDQAVAAIQGKSVEELSTKDRQFTQIVKGVQDIFNGVKNGHLEETITKTIGKAMDDLSPEEQALVKAVKEAVAIEMKTSLKKAQDSDTQVAVATIKKSISV